MRVVTAATMSSVAMPTNTPHGSSGIGLLGDFSATTTTPEAQAGLVWITAWAGRYLDPHGFADFHETANLPTICGHRDVLDETCPGDGAYSQLDTIRAHVADVLAGADPTITSSSTSAIPCRSSSRPPTCAAVPARITTSWPRSHGARS